MSFHPSLLLLLDEVQPERERQRAERSPRSWLDGLREIQREASAALNRGEMAEYRALVIRLAGASTAAVDDLDSKSALIEKAYGGSE